MLTKESERAVMEFSKLSQAAVRDYDSIYKEIGELNLLVNDILHELDPRNHIVGLPRKRKVSSKEAMELGLRLKEVVMRRRDLKDTLERYRVIREQVDTREIENVRKFVEGGRCRKYERRVDHGHT